MKTENIITGRSYDGAEDKIIEGKSDKEIPEMNACDLVRFLFDILL